MSKRSATLMADGPKAIIKVSKETIDKLKRLEITSRADEISKLRQGDTFELDKEQLLTLREEKAKGMSARLQQLNKVHKITKQKTDIPNLSLSVLNMQLAKPILTNFEKNLKELMKQLKQE